MTSWVILKLGKPYPWGVAVKLSKNFFVKEPYGQPGSEQRYGYCLWPTQLWHRYGVLFFLYLILQIIKISKLRKEEVTQKEKVNRVATIQAEDGTGV